MNQPGSKADADAATAQSAGATAHHHLRHLLTASLDMLTGIGIHNDRRAKGDIKGPVVDALLGAAHQAKLFLAAAPPPPVEVEPVGHAALDMAGGHVLVSEFAAPHIKGSRPLYTHPAPSREGKLREALMQIVTNYYDGSDCRDIARSALSDKD
jgi:hypothetical protein